MTTADHGSRLLHICDCTHYLINWTKMNRTIERPLVIVMFIISLLLLFAYVFYISFLKKTIDEGQISADVRNTILSSIRNNTSNDIDDDDLLAKIMLRKKLIQKNIFVRQIQRQESVRELSRLLEVTQYCGRIVWHRGSSRYGILGWYSCNGSFVCCL